MKLHLRNRKHKSILIAVLGAPNVGKSSLINCLLGTDLSIVCHKPQTTRNSFHCITTIDDSEIILVDTPGLHKSNQEFNKRLNQQAFDGERDADLTLVLIDLTQEIRGQFLRLREIYMPKSKKHWIVFTKSDTVSSLREDDLRGVVDWAKTTLPSIEDRFFAVSSKTEDGIHELTGAICDEAKPGPHLYDGRASNKNERFFVTEYIREQLFELLNEELPYECAVVIDEFKETRRDDDQKPSLVGHISASVLVNRVSQRAIVIGSKGAMIKEVGTRARRRIEAMLGGQIHLNLHVKVMPRWFKNNFVLEELGLPRAVNSDRVWRKK